MSESPQDRISFSRETLRAELSQLELRLVDRLSNALATKADGAVVDALDKRVNALELSNASSAPLAVAVSTDVHKQGERITKLERFRYAVPSTSVLAVAIAAAALVVSHPF